MALVASRVCLRGALHALARVTALPGCFHDVEVFSGDGEIVMLYVRRSVTGASMVAVCPHRHEVYSLGSGVSPNLHIRMLPQPCMSMLTSSTRPWTRRSAPAIPSAEQSEKEKELRALAGEALIGMHPALEKRLRVKSQPYFELICDALDLDNLPAPVASLLSHEAARPLCRLCTRAWARIQFSQGAGRFSIPHISLVSRLLIRACVFSPS